MGDSDGHAHVKAVYTGAVQMEAVGEDQFGADYALIHEPGGLSYCKHISFYHHGRRGVRHPGGGPGGRPALGLSSRKISQPRSAEFRRIGACICPVSVL
ncbi:hypothetical protein [Dysosmobacter welbionis]|uniref:hypothetical protein n=1 Tax=Dysosmobacter welbionis TaxID=2093857 RepID=UPI00300F61DD